jgi:hypothetical protein
MIHVGRSRRFRWLDGLMVGFSVALGVLAAWQWVIREPWDIETALGMSPTMASIRPQMLTYRSQQEAKRRFGETFGQATHRVVDQGFQLLPIVLLPTTLGVALATFRKRRREGKTRRSIGVTITALSALLVTISLASESALRWGFSSNDFLDDLWANLAIGIGQAVLALWLVLGLAERGRRPIDVWDWLGRALGLGWIACLVWFGLLRYAFMDT